MFAGAEQRARELGYSMELCWAGPKQVSLARLNVILRARNVHGVVVLTARWVDGALGRRPDSPHSLSSRSRKSKNGAMTPGS